jgi:hypothetical protein
MSNCIPRFFNLEFSVKITIHSQNYEVFTDSMAKMKKSHNWPLIRIKLKLNEKQD